VEAAITKLGKMKTEKKKWTFGPNALRIQTPTQITKFGKKWLLRRTTP